MGAAPAPRFTPGDRAFARRTVPLRSGPSEETAEVDRLLLGDEVSVQPEDPAALRDPPAGWLSVATTEVVTHRIFTGYVREVELSPEEPPLAARRAALRGPIHGWLDALRSREAAFAVLRDQAIRWRELPDGGAEGDRLAHRLAEYMAQEITPRALDALDRLAELRTAGDPEAGRLTKQLDELARAFQP